MGNHSVALFSALNWDVEKATGFPVSWYRALPGPLPDFNHMQFCAYQLCKSLDRKLIPDDTRKQDKAALDKFLECNLRSKEWLLRLNTSLDELLIGEFKSALVQFFEPGGYPLVNSLDDIFLEGRCGPGAGIGSPGGDFYSKMFSSSLSSTSPLLVKHYQQNVRRFAEWSNAELTRQHSLGSPRIVKGSRLSFVPKNERISRTICTEPVLNMFYQLGLGTILTRRLTSWGLSPVTQPDVNRLMAYQGSWDDGSYCTIDLESASDTISHSMVRQLLPASIVSYLDILRSRETQVFGTPVPLHMISSMGNGFTFPLQTIIFACAVKAVYRSLDMPASALQRDFGVFGDDIVVRPKAYRRLVGLLTLLGFTVNTAKSFSEGPFRESCGHDYRSGRNVRGVYPQRLTTPQDFYALANALNAFSARTGLMVPSLMSWVLGRCNRSRMVPAHEDPSSGLQVPLSLVERQAFCRDTQGTMYIAYVAKRQSIPIRDNYILTPKGAKRRLYNVSGLLIAFLSGMALSSGLPLRKEKVDYKTERRASSLWNSFPPDPLSLRGFDWQRWNSAVSINLNRL